MTRVGTLLIAIAATASLAACGDDTNLGPTPSEDGGNDVTSPSPDAGAPMKTGDAGPDGRAPSDAAFAEASLPDASLPDASIPDASLPDTSLPDGSGFLPDGSMTDGAPPSPDASDAGPCDFNVFVMGLITNHTNSTDLPSADIGQNCIDSHTLFPTTLFQ